MSIFSDSLALADAAQRISDSHLARQFLHIASKNRVNFETMAAAYRLSPGHIMMFSHLKSRLRLLNRQSFIEFGAGNGMVSRVLLDSGMTGIGFDLNSSACENNREQNSEYIQSGKYQIFNSDFLKHPIDKKVDVIISCMVLEHIDEQGIKAFFEKCKSYLEPNGIIISIVPGQMKFWGIEDDIAGHLRRYESNDFKRLSEQYGLCIQYQAGLTYPLSNWLLPLSNYLVSKSEKEKLSQDLQARTVASGNRNVKFKSTYPAFFKYLINEWTMWPFILLQKYFGTTENSLVIYSEIVI